MTDAAKLADMLATEADLQSVHPPRCPGRVISLMREAADFIRALAPAAAAEDAVAVAQTAAARIIPGFAPNTLVERLSARAVEIRKTIDHAQANESGWCDAAPISRWEHEAADLEHAAALVRRGVSAAQVQAAAEEIASYCAPDINNRWSIREIAAIILRTVGAGVEQSAWRPISDAPKDGTEVLLYRHGGFQCVGFWHVCQWLALPAGELDDITHWQPLLQPPEPLP